MTTIFISHAECLNHLMPSGHPECPERVSSISNQMIASGLEFCVVQKEAPFVTQEQLERVHPPEYLASIDHALPESGIVNFDEDVYLSPGTINAAKRAAGAGILGIDSVLRGEAESVFCNVRPPGHHAEVDRAMGFCLYSNIAVAAAHALEEHALSRVAIVDFDVHHGNGTQDIFLKDERVFFCSSFQHPFYPNTDIAPGKPNIINTPLAATASSNEFRAAVTEGWLPHLNAFKPELLLVSAGFDAHVLDDMSSVSLYDGDYEWVGKTLREFVDNTPECKGIVSMLEGGYDLESLGRCVCAYIKSVSKL